MLEATEHSFFSNARPAEYRRNKGLMNKWKGCRRFRLWKLTIFDVYCTSFTCFVGGGFLFECFIICDLGINASKRGTYHEDFISPSDSADQATDLMIFKR